MLKQTLNNIVSNRKKIILYVITVVISVVLLILGNLIVYDDEVMFLGGYDDNACPATVTEIVYKDTENVVIDGEIAGEESIVIFKCKITAGELKGETVVATESTSAYDAVPLDLVQVGDKILIARLEDAEETEGAEWFMHDYDRTVPLWILGALFILLVLLFGKMKGVNTLISLGFTCIAVFAVFVPSVLAGRNIYFWSIIVCIYITIMTLLITNGYNKKTLAAIIGCSSGVVVAGVLTVVTSLFLKLTGITTEETIYIVQNFDIDLGALTFGGVILGAVGAVMDVSVSISSSLKELHDQVESPTFWGLVKSGVTIGRDIMGTMANTLVLAYIGCELSATLLSVVYSSSMVTLFSREKIVQEILQALVGSIGILLTIPLTAVVSAALYIGVKGIGKRPVKPGSKKDKYYVEPSIEPSLFEKTEK